MARETSALRSTPASEELCCVALFTWAVGPPHQLPASCMQDLTPHRPGRPRLARPWDCRAGPRGLCPHIRNLQWAQRPPELCRHNLPSRLGLESQLHWGWLWDFSEPLSSSAKWELEMELLEGMGCAWGALASLRSWVTVALVMIPVLILGTRGRHEHRPAHNPSQAAQSSECPS